MSNLDKLGEIGKKIRKRLLEEDFREVKTDLFLKEKNDKKKWVDLRERGDELITIYAYKDGEPRDDRELKRLKRELDLIGDEDQRRLF